MALFTVGTSCGRVVAGEHSGTAVGMNGAKIFVVSKGFAKNVPLDKSTIKSYEVKDQNINGFGGARIEITYLDGKRSLIELDREGVSRLTAAMY